VGVLRHLTARVQTLTLAPGHTESQRPACVSPRVVMRASTRSVSTMPHPPGFHTSMSGVSHKSASLTTTSAPNAETSDRV
jgi:hypothetical protein